MQECKNSDLKQSLHLEIEWTRDKICIYCYKRRINFSLNTQHMKK